LLWKLTSGKARYWRLGGFPPVTGEARSQSPLAVFTKIPTSKEFKSLIEKEQSPYMKSQLREFRDFLNTQDL